MIAPSFGERPAASGRGAGRGGLAGARLVPLANALRRRLGSDTAPWRHAKSVDVLAPEEIEAPPVIRYLPGQPERATAGVPGHSSLAQGLAALRCDPVVHAPVIQYTFENALVHRFGFDLLGGSFYISKPNLYYILDNLIKVNGNFSYCNTGSSRRYFGHWLHDACATATLVDESHMLLLEQRPDWPDVRFYCEAFGLRPAADGMRLVRELTVYQDFSQGSSKRARYAELRRRLETRLASRPRGGPRLAYLSRGETGARRAIACEERLIEDLERRGFACLRMGNAGIEDTIQALRSAEIVVSMEGSHINHAYFALPPGAVVVCLVPHDRFTLTQASLSHAFGMRPGFLTLHSGGGKDGRDYIVDADEVMRTIDLF